MSDLPTGWAISSLKELLTEDGVFSDGDWVESKDQDPSGSIRLLQLADIGDGYFIDKSCRFINEQKFVELRCTELFENDVLIARMPDPLGRACLMPKLPQRCVTVVDVAVFRAGKNRVSGNWLMHTINAPQYRAEIELNSSGTTRKRISRGNLAAMAMPVAPLPEQKRIADKLDSVLARVDACRDRLDRLPALLKRFRQSILAAATCGRLTEDWRKTNLATDWKTVRLEEVAKGFSYGSAAKSSKSGAVPVLRMGNIQDGRLDWTDLVFTSDQDEITKYRLVDGDVLFNRTNSPELVGKTAVFKGERNAIYAGYLIRVRCTPKLHPDYLNYCLGSPAGRDYCWQVKSDGVSQSNINAKKLASFEFELPIPEEQTEIVRRVEILFAFADRLEARLATARRQVGQLTPALLAKAFRGELVPQDPADEPAAELLKRLAAQREAAPKARRGRSAA